MKDPQTAWVLLLWSAVTRANHTIRVLPPSASVPYTQEHDRAVWECFCQILGAQEHADDNLARAVASLPPSLGGLGLRSAERTAPAAYWASWVDALPVLAAKFPPLAAQIVNDLSRSDGPRTTCAQEAEQARETLVGAGASDIPTWHEAVSGAEPPMPHESFEDEAPLAVGNATLTPFENKHFSERVVVAISDPSRRALLLSQGGGGGGAWLRAIPSETVFTMAPLRFQVAIRRRLRWPLPLAQGPCPGRTCRAPRDAFGDHLASCNRTGMLKRRSRPIEKVWARITREAGARVREPVLLRDAGIGVDPGDDREVELVASGLPVAHGIPVAVDATMVSPLHADGSPFPHAESRVGVALQRGREAKARTYPELANSSRLRLLTAGIETGGRVDPAARQFLHEIATARARSEPEALRAMLARAFRARWLTMLSVVAQDALAATLVDDGVGCLDCADAVCPDAVEVWLDERV